MIPQNLSSAPIGDLTRFPEKIMRREQRRSNMTVCCCHIPVIESP